MGRRSRDLSLLLVLLSLLLGLAGCDNNPNAAPWQAKHADGSPWVVSYRAFPEDPRTLDPQVAYDELSHAIIYLVYDTFLTYNPLKTDYELQPDLASELPVMETQPDGSLDYLCKIKPGTYFIDDPCFPDGKGRELTSADFYYTWQRMADPKTECPIVSNFSDFVKGLDESMAAAAKAGHFDYSAPFGAITVVDRYTFRINLKKPYPQLKYWLAFPFTTPVAREAVDYYDGKEHDGVVRDRFRVHPVGTGAFKLAEFKSQHFIRLVRNDRYNSLKFPTGGWDPAQEKALRPYAGHSLPIVDEIQYNIIREIIPSWVLFKQGWLDATTLTKDTFSAAMDANHQLNPDYQKRGMKVVKNVELMTWYFMFNMRDPVLGKNAKLRQAMSTVFDTQKENEIFYNGLYVMAQQFLPPGLFGYDPNFVNPYRQTSVEKAKQLLAEAGYPNGIDPKTGRPLQITLDVQAGSGTERQAAEYEQSQFEQLGIRIKIQENLFSAMLEKQLRGNFQFVLAGWSADYPDPENYFNLLYSKSIPPDGYNESFYSNPEYDKLFEQMSTMENSPQRLAIIQQMNQIITDQCVIAPLYNQVTLGLLQPWTQRVVVNGYVSLFGGPRYSVLNDELRNQERAKLNAKNYWPLIIGGILLAIVVGVGIRIGRKRDA